MKNERLSCDLAIQKTGNLEKKVKSLEIQISKDEQYNRCNCVEYSSIPDTINDDNLEDTIIEACKVLMTENNIIYDLQFGFRQNFSTAYALINLTENIRQALDKGYIGCGIFVDLQKAFDTVNHEILLSKLNHYGIHGVSNDWFRSYLSDRQQYVSINGYESGLTKLNCGVPQGSEVLYFFYYISMTLIKP